MKRKYEYNGISLRKYCLNNQLNYIYVVHLINKGKTIEEAVNYNKRKNRCKYFYNDIPLTEYCKKNNLNYQYIIHMIIKKNLSVEEAINYKSDLSKGKPAKYIVDGLSLRQYCKKNNLSYVYINYLINKGSSVEDAINYKDVNKSKRGKPAKYIIEGMSLLKYCKENNLKYYNVIHKIYEGCSAEEAVAACKAG